MTTLLAESAGQLTVAISDAALDDLAVRSASEMVESGVPLIIVDPAGCFEPARMSHSARIGAIDPAGLMKHLHILRADSASQFEDIILHRLEDAFEQRGTRRVLIPDPLRSLYDSRLFTRDASRILGRVKAKLEELVAAGAQVVLLCRDDRSNLGTRSHFLPSLRAAADRVCRRY